LTGKSGDRDSHAAKKAGEWIRKVMTALGNLAPDVQATLLGQIVSAKIDVDDIEFSYVYDPRTSAPALSADHFTRNVVQIRRRRER
jgi:hypothetical protein